MRDMKKHEEGEQNATQEAIDIYKNRLIRQDKERWDEIGSDREIIGEIVRKIYNERDDGKEGESQGVTGKRRE